MKVSRLFPGSRISSGSRFVASEWSIREMNKMGICEPLSWYTRLGMTCDTMDKTMYFGPSNNYRISIQRFVTRVVKPETGRKFTSAPMKWICPRRLLINVSISTVCRIKTRTIRKVYFRGWRIDIYMVRGEIFRCLIHFYCYTIISHLLLFGASLCGVQDLLRVSRFLEEWKLFLYVFPS